MGSSKVVFLAAVSLMIGFYAIRITQADKVVADVGTTRSLNFQAGEIAKAGIECTIYELTFLTNPNRLTQTKSILGGTVTYTRNNLGLSSTEERVTTTGTFGGQSRTLVAILIQKSTQTVNLGKKLKTWSNWAVEKVYVAP